MRCARVHSLYEEYSAGTLEAVTASRMDQHLAMCPECRSYFEESDEISEIISQTSEVVHPGDAYLDDLTSRVMESLCDDTGKFKPFESTPATVIRGTSGPVYRPLWWAGAVAATLLLAPLLISLFNTNSGSGEPLLSQQADPETIEGFAIAKSARSAGIADAGAGNLDPSALGAVLPLGQGLIYNSIRQVSSRPSSHGAIESSPADARIELGTIEELLALEAVGTVDARQRMFSLLRSLGNQLYRDHPELERSGDMVLMKQTHLYHNAEEAFASESPEAGVESYRKILQENRSTILARRAALRLADYHYYEVGDFEAARIYYDMADGKAANLALTEDEAKHIRQRREQLSLHATTDFALLRKVHRLSHESWETVPETFRFIMNDPRASDLADDVARALMNRLASGSMPGDDIAFELVDLIEGDIRSWQNAEAKSWLHLLLGDIIWLKFESAEPAYEAFRSAALLNERTESADQARQRMELLREGKVVVFGR